jgi:hypothetical protein
MAAAAAGNQLAATEATMTPDNLYHVHTVEDGARERDLEADGNNSGLDAAGGQLTTDGKKGGHAVTEGELIPAGKKGGHGTIAWLSAPSYEMPAPPLWPPAGRSPVIALLDSGVRPHSWLPELVISRPFLLDAAAKYGWKPPEEILEVPADQRGEDFGSHWGHGTFLAGLIRLAAPGAQILSVQVMDKIGQVSENNVIAALTFLADHIDHDDLRVDVVLMAFGRQADSGDAGLKSVRDAIQRLSALGVRIVASAGNENSERTDYPAAFAADPTLSVVSVGARASATERASYSNYGVWVREWRAGTNVVSIMPLTTHHTAGDPHYTPGNGFAYWSGTSFAAATYAGTLAQQVMASETVPDPVAGS